MKILSRVAAARVGAVRFGAVRFAAVLAGALLVVGVVPAPAQAATTVITVDNATSHEAYVFCEVGMGGPPCGTVLPLSLQFYVRASSGPSTTITIGWQLVPGSATAGSDYTGPTTGSVVIAKNAVGTSFTVPLVFDGFNEPTEQFTVRLTSASVPANISDTGTGTIRDGTQIPADCTVSADAVSMSLDCTARPASQQWALQGYCWPFGRPTSRQGNTVTGNGRSTISCSHAPISDPFFRTL